MDTINIAPHEIHEEAELQNDFQVAHDLGDNSERFQNLKVRSGGAEERISRSSQLVDTNIKAPFDRNEIDWLLVGTNHFPSAFAAMMAAEPFDQNDDETIDLLVADPFKALQHRRNTLTAEKDLNRQATAVENGEEILKHKVARLHELNEAKKARKDMVSGLKAIKKDNQIDGKKPKPLESVAVGMDGFTIPNYIQASENKEATKEKSDSTLGSSQTKSPSAWLAKARDSIVAMASTPFKNADASGSQQQTPLKGDKKDDGRETLSGIAKNLKKEVARARRGPRYEVIDVFPLHSVQTFSVAAIGKHFPHTKARLIAQHHQWTSVQHSRPISQSLSALIKGGKSLLEEPSTNKKSAESVYYDSSSDSLLSKKKLTLTRDKKGILSYIPLPLHWEPTKHGESDFSANHSNPSQEDAHLLEKNRFFASDSVHLEVRGSVEYGKALADNWFAFRYHVISAMDKNRHLLANHHHNLYMIKKVETIKLRRTEAAAAALARRAAVGVKAKEESAERLIDCKMANYRRKQMLDKRKATIKETNARRLADCKKNKNLASTRMYEHVGKSLAAQDKAQARRKKLIQYRVDRLAAIEVIRKKRTEAGLAKRNVTYSPVEYW